MPKYAAGNSVVVQIGARPEIVFKVLAVEQRDKPHYQFDWEAHGYASVLNTVWLPETAIMRPAL